MGAFIYNYAAFIVPSHFCRVLSLQRMYLDVLKVELLLKMVLIILQWDPMITTLPGLYLASVGVIGPVVWLSGLTGNVVCSTAMLRFINLLFNCGNLYLLYLLICKLHHREKVLLTDNHVNSCQCLII